MAHSARAQQALSPLSGFPEWLPAGRVVEQHFIDVLRHVFELHGFSGIQTRAVEPLSELTRKGETSKEVYLLSRLQADPADPAAEVLRHLVLRAAVFLKKKPAQFSSGFSRFILLDRFFWFG